MNSRLVSEIAFFGNCCRSQMLESVFLLVEDESGQLFFEKRCFEGETVSLVAEF